MEKVLIHLFFIFLGLVQGFTEPIPISSSGHLILIRELFNITHTNLSFEIAVHFGSLFAICYVYRHTIKKIMFNSIHYVMTRDEQYKTDFNFFIYLLIDRKSVV